MPTGHDPEPCSSVASSPCIGSSAFAIASSARYALIPDRSNSTTDFEKEPKYPENKHQNSTTTSIEWYAKRNMSRFQKHKTTQIKFNIAKNHAEQNYKTNKHTLKIATDTLQLQTHKEQQPNHIGNMQTNQITLQTSWTWTTRIQLRCRKEQTTESNTKPWLKTKTNINCKPADWEQQM